MFVTGENCIDCSLLSARERPQVSWVCTCVYGSRAGIGRSTEWRAPSDEGCVHRTRHGESLPTMVDALGTWEELQGAFDVDTERTYVDGVRTRVQ
jgi:hypothetical protein